MMSGQLIWWIAGGVLVIAELMTGTFYLLMLALGAAAGGLVHVAGGSAVAQIAAAAVVALALLVALRRATRQRRHRPDASANRDVNLDIGATLAVARWQEGRARVPYRGADWDVELAEGERDDAQLYEVRAVRGSCLIVGAKVRN